MKKIRKIEKTISNEGEDMDMDDSLLGESSLSFFFGGLGQKLTLIEIARTKMLREKEFAYFGSTFLIFK